MILPSPPDLKEKHCYRDQNKWLIYGWGALSFVGLLTGMVLFSFTHQATILFLFFTVIVGAYLGLSYFIGIFGRPFDYKRHDATKREFGRRFPTIDVLLPSCGEDLEVLRNTFKWVRSLDYPEGRIHFWVLDDSGRIAVKLLADRFEFNYITRPNKGELKKAGNLRYAFPRTSSDLMLVLDADFCPRSDMLKEMIPYFNADPMIAIVQSPQFFRIEEEQPWSMKGAAYIQELFYRMIQVNRDTWGASICVGTCALYRREALEPHGGTYPIAYSEDLHTGFQAVEDGWRVKYIPLNLAAGLCPETMAQFFIQQTRWCTGSTSLLFSAKFWRARITLMQRLCYASGMFYYVATALGLFITPLPGLVIVWFFPERVFWFNYLFSLPSFVFSVVILSAWGRAPFGPYVLMARQVSYWAHAFALFTKARGSFIAWIPTGDAGATRRAAEYHGFKDAMFVWITFVTFAALAGAFFQMDNTGDFNFYPLIFFTTLNYWVSIKCFKDEA